MEKKSVLVIDDDKDMLDLVSAILDSEGYEVEVVSTEDEMLQLLTGGGRWDLIITDVWMPWMSGLQVAQFAEVAGHTTPVLFMSGFADPSLEERVKGFFGNDARLLRKPFDDDTLLSAIDDVLHPRKKQHQRRKKARTSRSASSRTGS